ncbi:helix-turn-helix transcriptional regulator [Microlunatus elymi]|uniref:Helix-turn-helix transcriptional regulator n=1 Tax=Microlunatus elymi TaxID=2596828 RepID=A0A516PXV0_9ACTN|nr:helix-turn-helix transcriptional regulator [Microlunatus elymi]QDP96008.1 helix-turn-helix transcriptional regulator [Microlunatus elymi]
MTSGRADVPYASRFATVATYPSAASYGPRTLVDEYEFVWLIEGTADWRVRDAAGLSWRTSLPPGSIALARPGDRDQFGWDPRRRTRHGYVHFRLANHPDSSLWPRVRDSMATPLLRSLCDHLVGLGLEQERLAEHNRLLGVLLEVFLADPISRVPDWPQPLLAMVEHIATRWRRDGLCLLPVAELAAAGHVSVGHASRLFHSQFGIGPAAALERVRLARAATALQRTNSTLAEVALATGYHNPFHLSRRFSQLHGLPPAQFRRSAADPLAPLNGNLRVLAERIL